MQRKKLSTDGMIETLKNCFGKIPEHLWSSTYFSQNWPTTEMRRNFYTSRSQSGSCPITYELYAPEFVLKIDESKTFVTSALLFIWLGGIGEKSITHWLFPLENKAFLTGAG